MIFPETYNERYVQLPAKAKNNPTGNIPAHYRQV
jgi:hypothetical protein